MEARAEDIHVALKTGEEARALEFVRAGSPEALRDWRYEGDGSSLLHWAALGGYDAVVLSLVRDVGIPVDCRSKSQQTPLMWASTEQHLITICLLLDLGADINARDDLGDNSLTLASQHERLFAAILLLSRGIDVNVASVTNTTPAHWAAFSGAYLVLALLESAGADLLTCYDKFGMLPFHRALQLEYYAIARMLVGFNPEFLSVKTADGQTLEEFAVAQELSPKWFQEFLSLCKDPTHPPPSNKLIFPNDEDSPAAWWEFRKRSWKALAGCLLKMEQNRLAKKLIPLLASLFGMTFTLSYKLELWKVHRILAERLEDFLPFSYGALLLLRALPYAGVTAIVVFHLLLLKDPGYLPPRKERETVFNYYRAMLGNVGFLWRLRGGGRRPGDKKQRPVDPTVQEWLKRKGVKKIEVTEPEWKEAKDLVDPKRICPTCWIQRGLRTKHCSICDRCCEIMDHHCLWLDRCVGKNNHQLFALFLLTGGIAQAYHMLLTVLGLVLPWLPRSGYSMNIWGILAVLAGGIIHFVTGGWSWALIQLQLTGVMKGMTVNETLSLARYEHFIVPVPDPGPIKDSEGKAPSGEFFTRLGQVQAEEVEEGVFIRKFTRNPFARENHKARNCLDFWMGRRPARIVSYEKLAKRDEKFVEEVQGRIRKRRAQKED